jgi:hypothetical protein
VRPVREQFEHDRVIRVLQAKYKRKYEVAINPGAEQNAAVGVGDLAMYPDLVLFSQERNRKVHGTIEVETTESINTLEAMAEWGPFSRLRTPFYLYVPAASIDTARRLCAEHGISPAEIWTYHTALDQVRFTMVHRSPDAPKGTVPELRLKPAPKPVAEEPEPVASPPVAKAPEPEKPARVAAKGPAAAAKAAPPKAAPPKAAKAEKPVAPVAKGAAAKAKSAKSAPPRKIAAKRLPQKSAKAVKAAKSAKTKSSKSAKPAKSAKSAKSASRR